MEAIVVAIIAAGGSIIGQWMISRNNRRKDEIANAVKDTKNEMRLDSIEKKLDEHNGYAEKFGDIAVSLAEIRTQIKHIEDEYLKK